MCKSCGKTYLTQIASLLSYFLLREGCPSANLQRAP